MKIFLVIIFVVAAGFGLLGIWTNPDLDTSARAGWSCAMFFFPGLILGLWAYLDGDI